MKLMIDRPSVTSKINSEESRRLNMKIILAGMVYLAFLPLLWGQHYYHHDVDVTVREDPYQRNMRMYQETTRENNRRMNESIQRSGDMMINNLNQLAEQQRLQREQQREDAYRRELLQIEREKLQLQREQLRYNSSY